MENQLCFYLNQEGELINIKEAKKILNPVIKIFGPGPSGERCKNCKHLFYKSYSKKYYKCGLRINNNSTKTDHKVNWPACGKFEKE